MHPTVNFALSDSDCVPTTLFEVAELVNLMTDRTSRAEAMQHHTMASTNSCPPAVLLMTESRAELNAGLIIVTGHVPARSGDVDMAQEPLDSEQMPDASTPATSSQATSKDTSDARAHKARRIASPVSNKSPDDWVNELHDSRASFLATTAVPEDPAEALRGGLLLTPLLGCRARTPLDWTHAWAMLGDWAGKVAFPVPAQGVEWPRHGHGIYIRPKFIHRTPPFLTWARPIFEQGALSPMSVLPANFPILCLPGDKLFQSKDIDEAYCLPPMVHAFQGNKVRMGKKLQKWQKQGLYPLAVALLGTDQLPPLWTHPTGSEFVRGSKLVAKSHVAKQRKLTQTQVLLLQCLWTPAAMPNHENGQTPWPQECQAAQVFCGQLASLQLPSHEVRLLLESLQKKLQLDTSNPELAINEILASHADPKYTDWKTVVFESTAWQLNPTDTGYLDAQCTGLGGAELDDDWDVLLACRKEAHVYGPSLSKQDDWNSKCGTIAGTAHTQDYLLLHLAMFPIGLHAWSNVFGMPTDHQMQAQIIYRAKRVLEFGPITPAHQKPPWPGYKQSLRFFTKLLAAHPLVGICRPPDTPQAETLQLAGYMCGSLLIRGHSAGSYAGMVWETILAEFPNMDGRTVLAAIAFPPSLLTQSVLSYKRQVHLIHHADDRLCVWTPSHHDMKVLQQ